MESLDALLCAEGSESLKSLCLKLLLCLVTVNHPVEHLLGGSNYLPLARRGLEVPVRAWDGSSRAVCDPLDTFSLAGREMPLPFQAVGSEV